MLEIILIAVVVVVILLAVVIALQPSQYRVMRSARMTAPRDVVFDLVNNFRKWEAWSPWEKKDPAMQRTFEGPAAGEGAIYAWAGDKNVGEGRMTLTESRPPDSIRIRLEFIKPFQCTNDVEFTFKSEGGQTVVTWTMTGKNNFMGKAVGLVMNMDKMIGKDFEAGLAGIRATVAAAGKG